ncbi:hypothetical protein [Pseudoalteromonas sp. APC 3691]|uniref:hypothetical protein n=1 Tax=Pseudoalteromonas sp. APC 3691 TaxID=3035173 RepID=UPI0025B3E5AC|nr:hypothetical protein [Pseudoalteromonas sp. APC 3691]MDN3390857.1 hypothetical protein [Pseudoalteromonas sp. APC 3691]
MASSGSWYREGEVTIINGSQEVTGTGSNWVNDLTAIAIGDSFTVDSDVWYEVVSIDSDTTLFIDRPFEGESVTLGSYAIKRSTSGTILTRIAGQIATQFNQKQLLLDEIREWLNSEGESVSITDSHGKKHDIKTPFQMTLDAANAAALGRSEWDAAREGVDTKIAEVNANISALSRTVEDITAVKWSGDGGLAWGDTEGVEIKEYNGHIDTPNLVQYNVLQSMGDVFDTGGTILLKIRMPNEKLNSIHRFGIAGGPATASRCFHISYYGGMNTNTAKNNHFEFNYKGTTADRLTLLLPYSGTGDIILCARKRADDSVVFSYIDVNTLEVVSVEDANANNVFCPNILDFSVANTLTTLGQSEDQTASNGQHSRFYGGLHSMFIYPTTLGDEDLLSVAKGAEISDFLGTSAQMARQFNHTLANGDSVPLAPGYTDLVDSMPAIIIGAPVFPGNKIARQSENSWILNSPIHDGDVFAAPYGNKHPIIQVVGKCHTSVTSVKARLVSPIGYSDWVFMSVDNGTFSGEIITPVQSEWLNIEVADGSGAIKHRMPKRIGAGYVVFAPNQSQFRIMSTSDSEADVATLNAGVKASMMIDVDPNYAGKWRTFVYENGNPIPDGIAAFFNYLGVKLNAPILMLNNAQSGTGVTQWLVDADPGRRWSDTEDCMAQKRGNRISSILWVWHTNEQVLGYDYTKLFDALLFNTGDYKSDDGHHFGNLFQNGYGFVVMPATRATTSDQGPYDYDYGDSGQYVDACRKVQRSFCDLHEFATAGPETVDMAIRDNGYGGPHEDRDISEGTWRLGYRCGIGVARGLGFDTSKDPYIQGVSVNASRTTLTVAVSLPNAGTGLRTDGFDSDVYGFEISEDAGGTWTRSGFVASIINSELKINKSEDAWAEGALVRYCYGGPLSYGAAVEPNAPYKHILYDGSEYEGGLGLPLMPMDEVIF